MDVRVSAGLRFVRRINGADTDTCANGRPGESCANCTGMRMMQVLCVSVVWVAAGNARAELPPASGPRPAAARHIPVAFGINLPFMWNDADSIAASLYIGASDHHAIRANVASYKSHAPVAADAIVTVLFDGDGSEASLSGRTTDVGIGWVYYPRSLWNGFMFEAGALGRARDVGVRDSNMTPERVTTTTTVYAARAMIGWSWLLGRRVFIATGVGLSVGRESGAEVFETDIPRMTTRENVARVDVTGEAYLRLGVAFDL
jgi:hypothetical protein